MCQVMVCCLVEYGGEVVFEVGVRVVGGMVLQEKDVLLVA